MLDLGFMGESTNRILLSAVMSFAWGLRLIPLVGNFLAKFSLFAPLFYFRLGYCVTFGCRDPRMLYFNDNKILRLWSLLLLDYDFKPTH